ncbi:AP-1 complex subunit sigma-1A [Echinococcus granulosus]|uniref:AP complex subunit sigma n=1 Tax=Echinococcus granulosus TaxID=6210 RepID=W6UMW9_ECHGR|nr:AP-1 complex subunit sigma-1A [Echinococcus granulosus]EUB59477.1 AP-1 complex subunit sigma-1A [Echinococcus granulosus]
MIHFLALFSRQGKVRLQKWFISYTEKEKKSILREVMNLVLARKPKMSSFLEWKDMKLVYRRYDRQPMMSLLRYASLYFLCAIEPEDNELLTLEIIHRYVEILDKYFGNVCELDIIFHFEKAYFVLDEYLFAGEVEETGYRSIMAAVDAQDMLQEDEVPQSFFEDQSLN